MSVTIPALVVMFDIIVNKHLVLCLVDESDTYCHRRDCRSLNEAEDIVYFGLMLSYPDPLRRETFAAAYDDGHDIAPAAYTAVEQINNHPYLLGNYTVKLIRIDGGCTVTERTAIGINELFCSCKPIVGIVGPSCGTSAQALGNIARHKHLSIVSIHYGELSNLGNRSDYPYAFGILGSSSTYAEAFIELIKNNNWDHMALLYSENDIDLSVTVQDIQKIMKNTLETEITFSSSVVNTYIPLQEIKRSFVRVIISLMSPEMTLRTLCLAYHEGLVFPNYQWVFKERLSTDFHEISFTYDRKFFSCSDTEIRLSINGSINLVLSGISKPLNGIDGVSDDINITSDDINITYREYITRYDLQRRDYIHKFSVTSNETLWARGIYDAVWSLTFALNRSLTELHVDITKIKPGNVIVAETISKHMYEVDFHGISGRIKFDNNTGFNIDNTINVYQYKGPNVGTIIGFYAHGNLTLLSDVNPMFINATFAEKRVNVELHILVLVFVVTVVSLLIAVPIHVISTVYRNHKVIKASSPRLNHLIFIGYYLILIGTFVFILSYSNELQHRSWVCIIIPWILAPGTTLIIGTVCVKTWRLYRIYSVSNKGYAYDPNAQLYISDRILSVAVVTMVTVDIIICLSWTISDRLKVNEHREVIPHAYPLPVIHVYHSCQSKYLIYWMAITVTYKGILTLCSLMLGIRTRLNINEFKTKNVIILVYAVSVVVGLGIPLYIIVTNIDTSSTTQFVVPSVILNIVVYMCMLTLSCPTLIPIIKERCFT